MRITMKPAARAAAAVLLSLGLLSVSAINAQAVTKTGYKYCSGGAYASVSLTAKATAIQKHVHKTPNGTRSVTSPGIGTLQSFAGSNSSDWTASTSGSFTAGPTAGCV